MESTKHWVRRPRTELLRVRAEQAELDIFRRASRESGLRFPDWVRVVLHEAAERQLASRNAEIRHGAALSKPGDP
jgi:hypothetical protein